MRILILEKDVQLRSALVNRVQNAYVQAGIKRAEVLEGGLSSLGANVAKGSPEVTFLGPGYYQDLEDSIARVRSVYPKTSLAVVLDNEVYAAEAVELRRSISARMMPLADVAQMAQFILDASSTQHAQGESGAKGVVAVTHFKGGSGASTVANALVGCWASHGLSVVLVDLDDLNPQTTDWAKVPRASRDCTAELLALGEVPAARLGELVYSVEHTPDRLSVVGQPRHYGESFHLKADVITGAPSSADFIDSLIPQLQSAFDIVVLDTGNSWGISTFAALPYCEHVVMVSDEDSTALKRSLDIFARLYAESDDPAEFDLGKWSLLLNSYDGQMLPMQEGALLVAEKNLFPDSIELFTFPSSADASDWAYSKGSFFDLAEDSVQSHIREVAFSLVPFRYEVAEKSEDLVGLLRKSIKSLVGA